MSTPKVSIVVPYYRNSDTLPACIKSVLELTDYPTWELIVVAGSGLDEKVPQLPQSEKLRVIRKPSNSCAAALNHGFALSPDTDVVRLHSDVVVQDRDWLSRLAQTAYSQPDVGVVGVRLVYPDGRIQSEGRSIISGVGFAQQHRDRRAFQSENVPGKVTEVDSASGALAYYTRAAILSAGGLDENYGCAWMDDDDFCFSCRRKSLRVLVDPGVKAVHYTRSDPPTFGPFLAKTETTLRPLVSGLKEIALKLQAERWTKKWGWDPFLPDLSEVRRLYGETSVCWRIGDPMRYKPSGESPSVDCCIVTWNSLNFLRRTLESLEASEYPAEKIAVYIANNGSTDGTNEYLSKLKHTSRIAIHVVDMPINTGVAVGLNLAISAGSGELIARLDDDIILPPDWLRLLVDDLRNRPYAGCVGMKTVSDDDRRALQWAHEQKHPKWFSHGDEVDAGQTDFLSRVAHVAGCCCLYRRDVVKACGLVDIRYSPTQWDDIDHGTVLYAAGYEILCEGRSHVVHKKTSGLDRSGPGMASARGNWLKYLGKWGKDIFETVDSALVLSREGRCLPPDGDTSAWMALGPDSSEFPRKVPPPETDSQAVLRKIYDNLSAPSVARPDLAALANDYLDFATCTRRDGDVRSAIDIALTGLNFCPARVDFYRLLGELYTQIGHSAMARSIALRGLPLAPDDLRLIELSAIDAAHIAAHERLAISNLRPQPSGAGLESMLNHGPRILLVGPYQQKANDSDLRYMSAYQRQLREAGYIADIRNVAQPDPSKYDVVHFFGMSQPHQTLSQIKAVKVLSQDTPVVITPLFSDLADAKWCAQAAVKVFTQNPVDEWERQLADIALPRSPLRDDVRPGHNAFFERRGALTAIQRSILSTVDRVLPASSEEQAELIKYFGASFPGETIPVGVETGMLERTNRDAFIKRYGAKDFVLLVGPIEPMRNQLTALYALRGCSAQVVIIGEHTNGDYASLCRKVAPKNTLFISSISDEMLASAYHAARVLLVPSWSEPDYTVVVQAALSGCGLALTEKIGGKSLFSGFAHYFSPENVPSMKSAISQATIAYSTKAKEKQTLASQLAAKHTWSEIVTRHLGIYESTSCVTA